MSRVPPTQLRHVVKALYRWFSVDVKVVDLPLLDREASFDVPLNETVQAITRWRRARTCAPRTKAERASSATRRPEQEEIADA